MLFCICCHAKTDNNLVVIEKMEPEVKSMKQKIAVEPSLTPIAEFLSSRGYDVQKLSTGEKLRNVDAYIITGMNKNLMGIGDTDTRAVVIDATGLTGQQVYQELQGRFS
jgi:hypothetical protein